MVFLKESISVSIGEMWIDGKITGTDASVHVRDFSDYNLDSGIYAINIAICTNKEVRDPRRRRAQLWTKSSVIS